MVKNGNFGGGQPFTTALNWENLAFFLHIAMWLITPVSLAELQRVAQSPKILEATALGKPNQVSG